MFHTRAPGGDAGQQLITACVAHPLLPMVFCSHSDASIGVAVFDSLSGKCMSTLPAHAGVTSSLSIDPAGLHLATCGADCDVRVWSINWRECLWRYKVCVRVHRRVRTRVHVRKGAPSCVCARTPCTTPTLHPTCAGTQRAACGGCAVHRVSPHASAVRAVQRRRFNGQRICGARGALSATLRVRCGSRRVVAWCHGAGRCACAGEWHGRQRAPCG
ncbi:hypothetical protein EON67_04330 [archaeon]|nr:MAG: hypothetical protein EON67_04330 [archaeon]